MSCGVFVLAVVLSHFTSRILADEGSLRIIEQPVDTVVALHSPATLNCRASGLSSGTSVSWIKDGRAVEVTGGDGVLLLPHGSLFVLSATRRHAGRYSCRATSQLDTVTSQTATLTVAVLREEFREWPVDTVAKLGSQVVLRCSPPMGDPPPLVFWTKNQQVLDLQTSSRLRLQGEGSLIIEDVRVSDEGEYVCEARNHARMRRLSPRARLNVTVEPRVRLTSQRITTLIGQDVELVCHVTGRPTPSVRWLDAGGVSWPGDRLVLTGIGRHQAGVYRCLASNSAGRKYINVTINVQAVPQMTVSHSGPILTRVGDYVVVNCAAVGEPPPHTFWAKDLDSDTLSFAGNLLELVGNDSAMLPASNSTLSLQSVNVTSEGSYTCYAVNNIGGAAHTVYVHVVPPNGHPVEPSVELVPQGGSVVLNCRIDGSMVEWRRNGRQLRFGNGRERTHLDMSLRLTDMRVEDSGWYYCTTVSSSSSGIISSPGYMVKVTGDSSTLRHARESPVQLIRVWALNSTHINVQWKVFDHQMLPDFIDIFIANRRSGEVYRRSLVLSNTPRTVSVGPVRPDSHYVTFVVVRCSDNRDTVVSAGVGVVTRAQVLLEKPEGLKASRHNQGTSVLLQWRPISITRLQDHVQYSLLGYRIRLVAQQSRSQLSSSLVDDTETTTRASVNASEGWSDKGDFSVDVELQVTQFAVHGLRASTRYMAQVSLISQLDEGPKATTILAPSVGLAGENSSSTGRQMSVKAAVSATAGISLTLAIVCAALFALCKRKRALKRGSNMKCTDIGKSTKSTVRPASWMYGSAWTVHSPAHPLSPPPTLPSSSAAVSGGGYRGRCVSRLRHQISTNNTLNLSASDLCAASPYATTEIVPSLPGNWTVSAQMPSEDFSNIQMVPIRFSTAKQITKDRSTSFANITSDGYLQGVSAAFDREMAPISSTEDTLYEQIPMLPPTREKSPHLQNTHRSDRRSNRSNHKLSAFVAVRSSSCANSLSTTSGGEGQNEMDIAKSDNPCRGNFITRYERDMNGGIRSKIRPKSSRKLSSVTSRDW